MESKGRCPIKMKAESMFGSSGFLGIRYGLTFCVCEAALGPFCDRPLFVLTTSYDHPLLSFAMEEIQSVYP